MHFLAALAVGYMMGFELVFKKNFRIGEKQPKEKEGSANGCQDLRACNNRLPMTSVCH